MTSVRYPSSGYVTRGENEMFKKLSMILVVIVIAFLIVSLISVLLLIF